MFGPLHVFGEEYEVFNANGLQIYLRSFSSGSNEVTYFNIKHVKSKLQRND